MHTIQTVVFLTKFRASSFILIRWNVYFYLIENGENSLGLYTYRDILLFLYYTLIYCISYCFARITLLSLPYFYWLIL